ncbi:MAG: ATP-grasp domain-containing protein [Clostridia bacterium]|nr:ATP-grasp domain-containing protein [Clostridia bacterium]
MVKNVVVIFGGVSNENEISVITGTMAINVLKSAGYTAVPVYISQEGAFYTGGGLSDINNFRGNKFSSFPRAFFASGGIYALNKRGKPKTFIPVDAALNCCHGGAGEDGGVCGLCALNNIPLASAGIFESSAFMDKHVTKLVLSALGIKTAEYAYVDGMENLSHADMPEFPVIVKPVSLGSSIGVEKAENFEQVRSAVENALIYDGAVIIEKYLTDRTEINCAAYFSDGKVTVSECEEAVSAGDVYSYEEKYQGGGKSVFPAKIPAETSAKIRDITGSVYKKLNMRGIVRFDFILSGGEIYLSEINTVPGSLSYYLLSSGFKDFAKVLTAVINQAEADFKKAKNKKLLKTGILENISSNACKTGRK